MKKAFLFLLAIFFSIQAPLQQANAAHDFEFERIKPKRTDKFECLFLGDTYYGPKAATEVILATTIPAHVPNNSEGEFPIPSSDKFKNPETHLVQLLHYSDINIANLETPLASLAASPLESVGKRNIHLGEGNSTSASLKRDGIHAVSLANNHVTDFGPEGLRQTCQKLTNESIRYFGAGENQKEASKPYTFEFRLENGRIFRVAVIGCFEKRYDYGRSKYDAYAEGRRPGVNPIDIEKIEKTVKSLRNFDKNILIVLFPHWGSSHEKITFEQEKMFRLLDDLGINVVIGQGAHTFQPIIKRNGRIIAFNIGDYFNHIRVSQEKEGKIYSLIVRLTQSLDEAAIKLRFYPLVKDSQEPDHYPRFAAIEELDEFNRMIEPGTDLKDTYSKDQFGFYLEHLVSNQGNSDQSEPFQSIDPFFVLKATYKSDAETEEKVNNCFYNVPFQAVVENYEHQITPYYCAVASGVIVLNTIPPEKNPLNLEKFDQTNFFSDITEEIKPLRKFKGERLNRKEKRDRGFSLDNLSRILQAYGLDVTKREAENSLSDEEIFEELKSSLLLFDTYVIINFARPLVGQEGLGHFSPLAAYDEKDDLFLIADTNLKRGKWLWIPKSILIKAMREFKQETRGYLIVRKNRT